MRNYDDIINLPHHESTKNPRMSALNRAAQFSPFTAFVMSIIDKVSSRILVCSSKKFLFFLTDS